MRRLLADTGYFVALGLAGDLRHAGARRFAERYSGQLVTTSAVIVEACHFLGTGSRLELLSLTGSARLAVIEPPVASYSDLAAIIRKYSDRDVDFADASLVWLAERSGLRQILTVDVADFSTFRLAGGKRFELVDWA